jgi:hypothetical protein
MVIHRSIFILIAQSGGFDILLLKTLKESGAPEAGAAGNALYITILLKVLALDVIAECETAVVAKREAVPEHVVPEGAIRDSVPDVDDVFVPQVAEHPRSDMFLPAAHMAPVSVPEKIAGMDIPIPGDECAVRFNKLALSAVAGDHCRESEFNAFFLCRPPCLLENPLNTLEPFFVPDQEPFQMKGDAP